jgi:hypothetical protein
VQCKLHNAVRGENEVVSESERGCQGGISVRNSKEEIKNWYT